MRPPPPRPGKLTSAPQRVPEGAVPGRRRRSFPWSEARRQAGAQQGSAPVSGLRRSVPPALLPGNGPVGLSPGRAAARSVPPFPGRRAPGSRSSPLPSLRAGRSPPPHRRAWIPSEQAPRKRRTGDLSPLPQGNERQGGPGLPRAPERPPLRAAQADFPPLWGRSVSPGRESRSPPSRPASGPEEPLPGHGDRAAAELSPRPPGLPRSGGKAPAPAPPPGGGHRAGARLGCARRCASGSPAPPGALPGSPAPFRRSAPFPGGPRRDLPPEGQAPPGRRKRRRGPPGAPGLPPGGGASRPAEGCCRGSRRPPASALPGRDSPDAPPAGMGSSRPRRARTWPGWPGSGSAPQGR